MSIENINRNTLVGRLIICIVPYITIMFFIISCHHDGNIPVIEEPIEYTIVSVNEFLGYDGMTMFVVTTVEAGDLYTSWNYVSLGDVSRKWYSSIITAKLNIGTKCVFDMYSSSQGIFRGIECLQ